MLADMAMKLEAARQLTYAAAARSERSDGDLTFLSAAAKCLASDTAMAVTIDAVQLLGGYGYTRDFPVERMMRSPRVARRAATSSTARAESVRQVPPAERTAS